LINLVDFTKSPCATGSRHRIVGPWTSHVPPACHPPVHTAVTSGLHNATKVSNGYA
jgi:hypothetical protein